LKAALCLLKVYKLQMIVRIQRNLHWFIGGFRHGCRDSLPTLERDARCMSQITVRSNFPSSGNVSSFYDPEYPGPCSPADQRPVECLSDKFQRSRNLYLRHTEARDFLIAPSHIWRPRPASSKRRVNLSLISVCFDSFLISLGLKSGTWTR